VEVRPLIAGQPIGATWLVGLFSTLGLIKLAEEL
jgi:hypothetical protein